MTARTRDARPTGYAARLNIDYPERLDRITTLFRFIWVLPISVLHAFLKVTDRYPPFSLNALPWRRQ